MRSQEARQTICVASVLSVAGASAVLVPSKTGFRFNWTYIHTQVSITAAQSYQIQDGAANVFLKSPVSPTGELTIGPLFQGVRTNNNGTGTELAIATSAAGNEVQITVEGYYEPINP